VVLARVTIGEFEQFWSVFTTAGAERRREHGSQGARVFRNQDDPNEVWLLFDWDREQFKAFLADPEVPGTMASGGAQGPPEVRFVEPAGELPV
jgi:heme-degrading monooxygenase HmoA